MPKSPLRELLAQQERDMITMMIAGLHEWRSDLNYPKSHSDMQACVRGLLRMYEIKRRPLPMKLEYDEE